MNGVSLIDPLAGIIGTYYLGGSINNSIVDTDAGSSEDNDSLENTSTEDNDNDTPQTSAAQQQEILTSTSSESIPAWGLV